ncbi:MAG: tRNA glutamyl-Q(34) synthetase GluQRS [Acidimicrobiia bacterium]
MTGRFAPSPTGRLHLGNLRTAMLAWLFARSRGEQFLIRMEDLDQIVSRVEHEQQQLDDLRAIGLDWDGPVVRQSERTAQYSAAVEQLRDKGLVYECFCTRAEIAAASSAPNSATLPGAYPGTCRYLSNAQIAERRTRGRPAALRLRTDETEGSFVDELLGAVSAPIDDLVLRRNDGTFAYNLAVVVDDAAQGVTHVVRGDDLAPSAPRQIHLAEVLGLPIPAYAHVPLVLGPDGERLAKRHGSVTLADRDPDEMRRLLAASLGMATPGERVTMQDLLTRFDPALLPREPWVFTG